jgi:hypothetical protein
MQHQTTVNSLVTRDLFLAIKRWQARQIAFPSGTHFRIMIPINERTMRHRRLPACNHCTMINLDRTREEVSDPDCLLAGIQNELAVIRRWHLSWNFWRVLWLTRRIPGGLARGTRSNRCRATTVFTNPGDVLRRVNWPDAGNPMTASGLRIGDIELVVPLRPGTPAGFAMYYYDDRFCLTLHTHPALLDQDQSNLLMECVVDQLNQSAGVNLMSDRIAA